MTARLTLFAAAALVIGSSAYAEPAKPQATPQPSRPVVLASADSVKTPAAGIDQQAPVKHVRVARVTTCRCGDQIPQDDEEQQ